MRTISLAVTLLLGTAALADAEPPGASLRVARYANLLVSGTAVGFYVGSKVWVTPLRDRYDADTYWAFAREWHTNAQTSAQLLTFTGLAASATNLVLEAMRPLPLLRRTLILTALGFLLGLAATASTFIGSAPVNTQFTAHQTPPENWMQLRAQWEAAHTWRAALGGAAFAVNLAAVTFD